MTLSSYSDRFAAVTVEDPGVDAVVVIGSSGQAEGWKAHVEAMGEMARAAAKPILYASFLAGDPVVAHPLAEVGIDGDLHRRVPRPADAEP